MSGRVHCERCGDKFDSTDVHASVVYMQGEVEYTPRIGSGIHFLICNHCLTRFDMWLDKGATELME